MRRPLARLEAVSYEPVVLSLHLGYQRPEGVPSAAVRELEDHKGPTVRRIQARTIGQEQGRAGGARGEAR